MNRFLAILCAISFLAPSVAMTQTAADDEEEKKVGRVVFASDD